jgi:hypothetical protein
MWKTDVTPSQMRLQSFNWAKSACTTSKLELSGFEMYLLGSSLREDPLLTARRRRFHFVRKNGMRWSAYLPLAQRCRLRSRPACS